MSKKEYKLKCYEGGHPRIMVSDEFIETNKLKLSRSSESVLEKIEKDDALFNFSKEVLVNYLEFDTGASLFDENYIKDVKSGKTKHIVINDVKETAQDFLDYMVFAWRKSSDKRGLSASRSVDKLSAWAWLLGREDIEAVLNDDSLFNPYGMPALICACEKLNITVPEEYHEFSKNKVTDE